jgi:hypothetical protein
MKKFQTIKDHNQLSNIKYLNLFLRGSIFRTTYNDQQKCIKSIFRILLKDLIRKKITIRLFLTNYKTDKTNILLNIIKKNFNGKIINIQFEKKKIRNQSSSFVEILKIAKNFKGSALIIRPDLIYSKEIKHTRLHKDYFLFQWNHFHDFAIKEVPDQLHFVGENMIKKTYLLCKKNINKLGLLPNNTGQHTLHNLYNILEKNFVNISYIFYISNVTYNGSVCYLRGNSHYSKISHFYKYTTPAPKKNFLKQIIIFLNNLFNMKY